MSISIALAEDNMVNRSAFMQKIKVYENLSISFIANDGNECLEMMKGLPHAKLPQVVFVDIEMPGLDGIDTIKMAKSLYPQLHFIVLTVFDDDDKIFEAIKAGASGYLLKHESHSVLFEAIENVMDHGGAPMSPAIARKALQILSKTEKPDTVKQGQLPEGITDREKEILQYTVTGWDAKRIAETLDISVLTVRKHTANIYQKLHVQSKAQVMQMAHKNNWFEE